MMTNHERAIKVFIPAFRLKAAQMMVNEYGIKQQQVAQILGTTQAAISKYLKEKPEKYKGTKNRKQAIKGIRREDARQRQKVGAEDPVQDVPGGQEIRLRFDCKIVKP